MNLKLKLNENKKRNRRGSLKNKIKSSSQSLTIRFPNQNKINHLHHQEVIHLNLTKILHLATAVIHQAPETAERAKAVEEDILLLLLTRKNKVQLQIFLLNHLKRMRLMRKRENIIHLWLMKPK